MLAFAVDMNWRAWLRTLSLFATLVGSCATDYCEMACGANHIACNNDGRFGPDCPANARVVDLTDSARFITTRHNYIRSKIASGNFSCIDCEPLPRAARMSIMQWDAELAQLAVLHVRRCKAHRDRCRSTEDYPGAGQSTEFFTYTGKKTRYSRDRLLESRLGAMFYEGFLLTKDIVESFPQKHEAIDRISRLAIDENTHVGCAAAAFDTSETLHHFLLTCNYAVGNIVGRPIYITSDTAGSGCKKGVHEDYFLCNSGEYEHSYFLEESI